MTIIHIVLFKFRPDVSEQHQETFTRELKKLKSLSCVKDNRLIVGGASITDPIERSKGFQYALLSYHADRAALEEYQASKEHHWVTSTYLFPFKEDICRYDFEVDLEDEYMCDFGLSMAGAFGRNMTPVAGVEERIGDLSIEESVVEQSSKCRMPDLS